MSAIGHEGAGAPREVELARVVREEQVRALYARGRIALLANLVNAALLVAVLWGSVPRGTSVAWLVAMYTVVGVRLVLHRRHPSDSRDGYDAGPWALVWIIGTGITGALWGSTAFVLFPSASLAGQHLLLFVVGGMVAGASASMSSYLPAFLAFTVPALVPCIVRLLGQGAVVPWAMALLMAIFGLGMTSLARSSARALVESVRLRTRNLHLVDDLIAAREELTQLNRELEQRVAARTRELEQAFADRDNFVSVISHELRTPLQAMKLGQGLLDEMLREEALEPTEMRSQFALLSRQVDHMQRTVDDLLDVSRLSTERMRHTMERVELEQIVNRAVEQMSPLLANRHVDFEVRCEGGVFGDWDAHRLVQVLINLMSNALKHGKPPFSLTAGRRGDSAEITVRDHGGGIPPEHLQRIFGVFERAEAHGAGAGLGLYIADRIVRAHHGTIRAESSPGRGTAFVVELPLRSDRGDARTHLAPGLG